MNILHETAHFSEWLESIGDIKTRMRILARINRARAGSFGEYKVLDDGLCEMKIDFGPGYRVYYAQEGLHIYILLVGGDKSSQQTDIAKAKKMWRAIKEERQ